ncbi:MAG: hypothetical protein JETT_3183 [Candidatus Jettenia ecosi]|uniref:Uncharacterized protein n=1 Tax=Candidatus Jettenia ecosi TaxID=2494326 RepID=A0A533Q7D5_9BACT|nr:MAG: hypothetical protein JETT_3183 [Candidatus Jettenia ecosi]
MKRCLAGGVSLEIFILCKLIPGWHGQTLFASVVYSLSTGVFE